jgi:hypothetical protein
LTGAALAAALAFAGCSPRAGNTPSEFPNTLAARREIWAAIQPMASVRGIDPLFVYAIVKLESNFDPHAKRGEARGLMQIKPRAWKAASDLPYETVVWDWRSNLAVGMDSLASIKRTLTQKGVFSYPMLWASYHYGLDFTTEHGFDMSRIPRPSDPISYKLWSGDSHPIGPPK